MKYFLWFNLNKLKTDIDYFLVTFLIVSMFILNTVLSYIYHTNKYMNFSDIFIDIIILFFWLWLIFAKKDFSFWKVIAKLFFVNSNKE
jgi:hypothetical protein